MIEVPSGSKTKKAGKSKAISKTSLNIVRTTYRNNIELTNIADNKANILLSLNTLMLTILMPIVLTNLEIVKAERLYLPLFIIILTCLVTIIYAAMATRPIKMGGQIADFDGKTKTSPFFFGNYYKMKLDDYMDLLDETLSNPEQIKDYIKLDMYFLGKGLGEKYTKVRRCYSMFMLGIVLTVIASVIVML